MFLFLVFPPSFTSSMLAAAVGCHSSSQASNDRLFLSPPPGLRAFSTSSKEYVVSLCSAGCPLYLHCPSRVIWVPQNLLQVKCGAIPQSPMEMCHIAMPSASPPSFTFSNKSTILMQRVQEKNPIHPWCLTYRLNFFALNSQLLTSYLDFPP